VPRMRQALESVFEKEKTAGAQYVLIGIGRQLQVLVPATTNPLALEVKIRSAAFQNMVGGLDASALAAQLQNVRSRMEEFCKQCACGARAGQRGCDSEVDTLKQNIDQEAGQWAAPTRELLAQFKSVVEELAKLPTGRTLILVSDGFAIDPKREFYAAVSAYLPNRPEFKLDDTASADPLLRQALEAATARNVIIDTIDSRTGTQTALSGGGSMDASSGAAGSGIDMLGTNRSASARRAPVSTSGIQSTPIAPEASPSMEQLARSTGGVYFHSTGDLLKEFRNALADGREYYVLAYVPKNGARDGKFRAITVETANKNLTLRAKPGYWAPGAAQ
jgi:VWFA-related protein